jgi:hypothetical protein
LGLFACATTQAPAEGEEYESRQEVMRREEQREAQAFDDRLARLRREEEEKAAGRAKSSSVAPEQEELPEEAKDLAGAQQQGPGGLEVGSSVRALEPKADDPTPEEYLRGARCLLSEAKSAIVMELMRRIDAEMKHRRLPVADGECKQHQEMIELLRPLVGAFVDQRAADRLTKELERRAGLPRVQEPK